MNERIIAGVVVLIIALLVLLFLGCTLEEPAWVEVTYTVRPGDTLWDIAQELGIENYDKWHYEVCKRNGIPSGGLIFPGDEIVLMQNAELKENPHPSEPDADFKEDMNFNHPHCTTEDGVCQERVII